jgi:hypothetical protein
MSDKDCGNCDYQGDFITPQGVECWIDQKVHERGYRCQDFKPHFPGKNQIVRLEQARAKREEREAKASEERNREFAEKMAEKDRECADKIARINREHDEKLQQKGMAFERRQRRTSFWRQVVLAVFSASLGIAGTLIVQALTK